MSGKRTRFVLIGAAAALTVVAAFCLYMVLPRPRPLKAPSLAYGPAGALNILIIGKDARAVGPVVNEGRQRNKREDQSHSDIIIICHINFSAPALNLVAIPRDLLVQVPGITRAASPTDFTNMEKITHTYAIGGERLLRRTIESLLGIRIDRSIAFDFDTFRMAFDLLRPFAGVLRVGGVSLTERNQALKFARRRHGLSYDDADRCRNAVSFVRAIVGRTWWLANTRLGDALLQRLLAIIGTDTDLTKEEVDEIAGMLRQAGFNPAMLRTAVLVSEGAEVTLARYNQTLSCYLPAYREIEKQVDRFLLDKKEVQALDFMSQQPYRVPAYFESSYVVTTAAESGPPALPFDTTGMDSQRLSTSIGDTIPHRVPFAEDSPPADSGR
jgi:LCP family protein required for cell wall assembly